MHTPARPLVFIGLSLSLAVFSYLTLSAVIQELIGWITSNPYTFESFGLFVACIYLIEIPFAIDGIAKLRRYNTYRMAAIIISIVFDGIFGLIFLTGLVAEGFVFQGAWIIWLITIGLLASFVLLIVGAALPKKASTHSLQTNSGVVPSAVPAQPIKVEPVVAPMAALETNKTASALAVLKNLYEQHLITEEEYTERKRRILDRTFSNNGTKENLPSEVKS